MKITSKLDTSYLTANDAALHRCQIALELKDQGDFVGAQEVMSALWKGVGDHPEIKRFHPAVAAEVLLTVGILTCWIGSKSQIKLVQETAKDLIGESINFFRSTGDIKKVAAARVELAYCYWCEGGLNEARIMFSEALERLTSEGNTRARALLGLAVVEWSASRYAASFKILSDNETLFKRITNHTIRGTYHNQLAMLLRNLASTENRTDYFEQAIGEYQDANREFKSAHNSKFRADVQNNLGFLFHKLSHYKKAHEHLDEARRLTLSLKDKIGIAKIDETRAQVLIAQGKFKEAEVVIRHSVKVLGQSDQQCLLADSLITHGIALARLGKREQAQFTFQRAIEVANQVDALNKAGLAALSLIEELDELPGKTLHAAFHRASEWLANAQSQDLMRRFTAAAEKVFAVLSQEMTDEEAAETLFNEPCDFQKEMLRYEALLIKRALAKANGRLTGAASQLNMSYQALAYIIGGRHKDLLKDRTPIRRRSRKI